MKRFTLSFALLSVMLFTLAKCGSADAGEKTANSFFSAIVKKDFGKAENMIDRSIGDSTNLIQQLQYIENNPTDGQLLSFKKSLGFNTKINNGVTTVELPYVLSYENGDKVYAVIVQNRGRGNRIVSVQ